MEKILIYTDGGCRGNPGVGGWGVWLRYKDHDKKYINQVINSPRDYMTALNGSRLWHLALLEYWFQINVDK